MTDAPSIRRVVIAGGGTAGWLTATALSRHFAPLIEITLVESEEIGTIGVGESTVPTARSFHQLAGVDEQDFMRTTGATFKLGISFENWIRPGGGYIHSFGRVGHGTWMGDFQHLWLHAHANGQAGDIGDYCYELQAAKAGRFATSAEATINYAYHLDAGLYARFLRALSEERGVRRVEGRIDQVEQHPETGDVTALRLQDGQRIEGDLFIDCTGFRGLLIEQALKAGFEDWGNWIPTNSAVAAQTRSVREPIPLTRAIAHEAGWRWEIPLQHRVGNGFVYCSDFMSDAEAQDKFLSAIEGELLIEPRLIRFRTGRRRSAWSHNVIAIGLASGFIEPLESTSIHLIMTAVTKLIQAFPFAGISPAARRRHNQQAREEMEHIRDFIILHYHLNERDEPFWKAHRKRQVPDTLAERIALFREGAAAYQGTDELFRIDSWMQVMIGQGLMPEAWHPLPRLFGAQLPRALADIKANIATAVAQLPSQQAFINRYCAASDAAVLPRPQMEPTA